ncbi:hypothetical protein WME89_06780 [Sorangium sp. So ce321]|uniref:hypothetical protein n=1 Tax=Sorangium sp. So ce321 TaxID=3133300 RepID=UPI003F61B22F
MGTVVAMLHAGLRCAFPARQVLSAEGGPTPERGARLWEDAGLDRAMTRAMTAAPEPAARCVRVATGGGPRAIACAHPRLAEVDRERVWPLPQLLADVLRLPHVVGLAEIDGALHWVIDARRLPADGA